MLQLIQSLVLYFSDDPEKMHYFSVAFTDRINKTSHIRLIQDKKIEDEFFVSKMRTDSTAEFEKTMLNDTHKLKQMIQNHQLKEAETFSNQILSQYHQDLLKHPHAISNTTRVPFYFWNTIANLNNTKSYELIGEFLSSAILTQKNLLEAELTHSVYKKYLHIIEKYKTQPQTTFTIQNSKSCSVLINGRQYSTETFTLSDRQKSIFTALCDNGFYSQVITTQSNHVIKITPKINKSLNQLPSFDSLPWQAIKNSKYQHLTLIYWSKKSHYIQTIVTPLRRMNNKYTLLLQLKAKNDLQIAGDKIFEFISNHFKYLIELDTF